jgi:CheY-like chemotaxis protein
MLQPTVISGIENIKILVVEDFPMNQLLMKSILLDFGFQFDIAENGEIALSKMKENNYDMILMDLQMPVMNGFEATTYIRNTMKSYRANHCADGRCNCNRCREMQGSRHD